MTDRPRIADPAAGITEGKGREGAGANGRSSGNGAFTDAEIAVVRAFRRARRETGDEVTASDVQRALRRRVRRVRERQAGYEPPPGDLGEYLTYIIRASDSLAKKLANGTCGGDLDSLENLRDYKRSHDHLVDEIYRVLGAYYSWAQIADALGVSRQAVAQRQRRRTGMGR